MSQFLSNAWFEEVNALTAQAGELNLAPALKNLAINLQVTDAPDGQTALSFYDGTIHQGSKDGAATTLSLDSETLRAVFLEQDMAKAMQAFMSGKIKVDGDMSSLMTLQTVQPSAEQKALAQKIMAVTD